MTMQYQRPESKDQRWWQFTLREMMSGLSIIAVYFALVHYLGVYIVFAVSCLALVATFIGASRTKAKALEKLLFVLRVVFFGQFYLPVVEMIREARDQWPIDQARSVTLVAGVALVIPFWIWGLVLTMRPTIVLWNTIGMRLDVLSGTITGGHGATTRKWYMVRAGARREMQPTYLSGTLVAEYRSPLGDGRCSIPFTLGHGEMLMVDLWESTKSQICS